MKKSIAKRVLKNPRPKMKPNTEITKAPDVQIQPHIAAVLDNNIRSGRRKTVYDLSENKITPNKKIKTESKPARYGSKHGLGGPKSDFAGPIVRVFPRGVSDIRQLMINAPNNEVPNEFGVTNKNRMPMQNISPTRGGKYSGRTGPIR